MEFLKNPLNYTGGKYKLLPQIFPLFPKNIDTFIDLFCGGCDVGINVNAKNIILNDNNIHLIEILKLFQQTSFNDLEQQIWQIIQQFNLSKGNKISFNNLRNFYNLEKNSILLYVLIIFSFNNQFRFNKKGMFNTPFGRRDFNLKLQNKLKNFVDTLKNKNIKIFNKDFRDFYKILDNKNNFFYIDPPYLLADAEYNRNWTLQDEKDLLNFCDILNSKNIKFALSNVISHSNKEHLLLKKWLENNNYKLHLLNYSYKNCSYQRNRTNSQEVLITNY